MNISVNNGYGYTTVDEIMLFSGPAFSTNAKSGTHAGSFDGVDDYVAVGDSVSLDVTTAATFEAWVYLKSYPSVTARILSKWQLNDLSYVIEIGPTGIASLTFSTTGGNVVAG